MTTTVDNDDDDDDTGRRGRTLSGSGQIRIRTRGAVERYAATYTRIHTHTRASAGAHAHHAVDQPAREPCAAVPCRGISAAPPNGRHAEPRLRPPSQHCQQLPAAATDVSSNSQYPSPSSWVVAAPQPRRSERASERARHTPARTNQRTNECTTTIRYLASRYLASSLAVARPRSTVRTTVPTCRRRPIRVESNRTEFQLQSRGVGRARFATSRKRQERKTCTTTAT
ncbi:hypothetical protein ALC57_00936 [Trachymyrmex cornetzi]|uniref:Uncharacterized protein n=1 Tax=Trachymyrmex cornetzi TaxID=471704 RepID=A0A195ENA7_9HYME|nr:hypothetical protein ALC57_00936 [Trachymyrmex cornetzi]